MHKFHAYLFEDCWPNVRTRLWLHTERLQLTIISTSEADLTVSAHLHAASADVYQFWWLFFFFLTRQQAQTWYASHIHSTNYTLRELIHLHQKPSSTSAATAMLRSACLGISPVRRLFNLAPIWGWWMLADRLKLLSGMPMSSFTPATKESHSLIWTELQIA